MIKLVFLILNVNLIIALPVANDFYLKTISLPADLNFMPSLANGHLGFTVFGDAIYVNGVYNGHGGNSRRARLPNFINVSLNAVVELRGDTINQRYLNYRTEYGLNLRHGYFEWQQNFVGELQNISVIQKFYAHRYFSRAVIYDLQLQRTNASDTMLLELKKEPGIETNAFKIVPVTLERSKWIAFKASTRELEHEQFQQTPSNVYFALSDEFPNNKKTLYIEKGQNIFEYRLILTADPELPIALKELEDVQNLTPHDLLAKHTQEWLAFWQGFHIEIKGSEELSQIVNAGVFYMGCNLPSTNTNQPKLPFYGLSPTGLGHGKLDSDYQGHNFWDTEIWMLPVVTQMNIDWTLDLFEYRFKHLAAALYNANVTGFKGARYPWESAFTGTEVTNLCCPEVAHMEVHISADIVFALQQFYAVTQQQEWLCNKAWPLIRSVAEFLVARVFFNSTTDQYHIKDVMGPDEDHAPINDNVYTNVIFKTALEFASFTLTTCQPKDEENMIIKQKWLNIAEKIVILYNRMADYHPQYDGYTPDVTVKQADAILLGYPLQFPMSRSTRYNDLQTYAQVTRDSGPAMTWSMFAINYLDVNNQTQADHYFVKAYQGYVRPEFKVWSEVQIGFSGSANFLTGVGGFVQTLLFGYAGIRFHFHHNKCQMLLKQRYLPPGLHGLTIRGLKFSDSIFSLEIAASRSILKCLHVGKYPLMLARGHQHQYTPLTANCTSKFYASYFSTRFRDGDNPNAVKNDQQSEIDVKGQKHPQTA